MIPADAGYAKITLLNGSSAHSRNAKHASNAQSLRHPAVARLQKEYSESLGSSPPVVARDANGRIRELRRQNPIPRQDTSSSWTSSRLSREGSVQIRKSASYKRGVIFPHRRGNSSIQRTPPPRPRNPTPLTLQQRYIDDAVSSDPDLFPTTPEPPQMTSDNMSTSPPPVRSRKENRDGMALDLETKQKNRTSALWEERTRQISAELSELCDEVFKGSTNSSKSLDKRAETEKLRTFARKSLDLPSFHPDEIEKISPIGPPPKRPLPEPPVQESRAMQTYRQLAQTKERLETFAQALGSNELDNIIHQIDRLIATNAGKVTDQEHKRIQSAPDPRGYGFQSLSPVREEDDGTKCWGADSSRYVSEPIGSHSGYQQAIRNVEAWNYPYSIRPVNDEELKPRPLTIKKKASEPILKSPKSLSKSKNEDHSLKARLKAGNASTSALDKIFGSSARLGNNKGRLGENSTGSQLEPIVEHDNKKIIDSRDAKRSSGDSQVSKWFRRSGGSSRNSAGSGFIPEHAIRDSHSTSAHQSGRSSEFRTRNTSNTTSDDIPFRPPQKESATSKFLKFFSKKDKRMHIAMTSKYSSC